MIIKYGKISKNNLFDKIESICKLEKMEYTNDGIEKLLFLSDYDIRQSINNLECMYYSGKIFNAENIYNLLDKPKQFIIEEILKDCQNNNLSDALKKVEELYNKGYTPNDILLILMKNLMENNEEKNENNLKIYEIISLTYIRVNGGIDTLLQLCGCISKICLYLK
jgi:replication factor C subunit 2/4